MADDKLKLEDWQQYPVFTELLSDYDSYMDLRNKCVKTCKQLEQVLQSGSPDEKEMAQKSINAYGHALGLLEEAIKARDKIVESHGG